MNIITIDPSLNCTAVVVNDHKAIITSEGFCKTKKGSFTKWFELCEKYIEYYVIKDMEHNPDFSLNSMNKLMRDYEICDHISKFISKHVEPDKDTKVFIEGYSFSSVSGPLIDLVELGTLIRNTALKITNNITIIPPKTLKLNACRFAYGETIEKGKVILKNKNGVKGGSFTKKEMLDCLVDSNIKCDWVEFLRINYQLIINNKNIPKPIEDINDAKLMYDINKNISNME